MRFRRGAHHHANGGVFPIGKEWRLRPLGRADFPNGKDVVPRRVWPGPTRNPGGRKRRRLAGAASWSDRAGSSTAPTCRGIRSVRTHGGRLDFAASPFSASRTRRPPRISHRRSDRTDGGTSPLNEGPEGCRPDLSENILGEGRPGRRPDKIAPPKASNRTGRPGIDDPFCAKNRCWIASYACAAS